MLTRWGVAIRPRLPRSATISTVAGAEVGGAIDYTSYLTRRSRSRRPSAIRALQPLVATPGMISLGGGMPNPSTFPFAKLTAELTDGTLVELSGASLEAALQYSPTQGLPTLVAHLERLQDDEHGRASEDRQLCVTTGSADALSKAFDALLVEGDALLVESPTYSGSLAYLQPLGCRLVGVPCDGAGLQPAALEAVLAGWDEASEGARRPRVLYTIPTGRGGPFFFWAANVRHPSALFRRSNPTGASLDAERKRDLYAVARRYGLIILEDDPYYWRATLAWMVLGRRSGGVNGVCL